MTLRCVIVDNSPDLLRGAESGGDPVSVRELAVTLLADLERLARRSADRVRGLLASDAQLTAEELRAITSINMQAVLEAVRDADLDARPGETPFQLAEDAGRRLGIMPEDLLHMWRIGVNVVSEEANSVSERLAMPDAVVGKFVEATRRSGAIGMRASAAALRESGIRGLERLAEEQAALRRVAMVVARERSSTAVFAKVAEELSGLLGVNVARIVRFEPDGTGTVLAARGITDGRLTQGANFPIPTGSGIAKVLRTGRPARLDDFADVEGPIGAILRDQGAGAGVAGPIVVDGRLWGAMAIGASSANGLPSGSEGRIARFAQLVSAAIAGIESRAEVERLAAEQSALRRVAELVARQAASEAVFALVTEELSGLLGVEVVRTLRFESEGRVTVVAARGRADDPMPPGTTLPIAPGGMLDRLRSTGRPARFEDYSRIPGQTSAILRGEGTHCAVGGPIVVDGRLWGAMVATASSAESLPPGSEDRVARFAELVSTAISNLESREKVERLAAEQASLRRVAELVARQARADEVFAGVTEELGRLMNVDIVKIVRFEPDGTGTVLATHGITGNRIPRGSNNPIPKGSLLHTVVRTGGTARVSDYAQVEGPLGDILRDEGARCGVGAPLLVDGRLWGAMAILARTPDAFPPGAEERVNKFCELISTAISNLESREKVERLAAEQSALRRVATLVAREHSPEDLFATLAEEVRVLLGVDAAEILRYEPDATATMLAGWSSAGISLPVGERLPLEGDNLASDVLRTGAPGRKEDYAGSTGVIAALTRAVGVRSAVGCPILVEGTTWGMIAVASRREEPLPPETEARLVEFSRHAGMAVANAKSRTDLAESRARIVRTGDEARRRFERNLHDGAQQRLVSMGFGLRAAEAAVPPEFDKVHRVLQDLDVVLTEVVDDLREISQGLHPAALSEGGLDQALRALARRSAVPIELRLELALGRLDEAVEVTAYYVTSEALTNAAKHAGASRVEIRAREQSGWIELSVSDDGRGGADPSAGTGLTGLVDRVEAIGGTIHLDSPANVGTTIRVRLPIHAET